MRTRPKFQDFPFYHLIKVEDGCWVWQGHLDKDGYAKFVQYTKYKSTRAQRIAYELCIGPIPEGFVTDHTCRNRACVKPSHLEAVSSRENTLRGEGFPAQNFRKTQCKNGHAFTASNTRIYRGRRRCRTCHREYMRKWVVSHSH